MLIEMIKTLLMGVGVGINAFVKAIPLYEQISGIKEELIANVFGIVPIVVPIVTLIPLIIKTANSVNLL